MNANSVEHFDVELQWKSLVSVDEIYILQGYGLKSILVSETVEDVTEIRYHAEDNNFNSHIFGE